MSPDDRERSTTTALRLTRAAIGLGVSLAMLPVRLVLRAIVPPPQEQRWEPISEPPAPAATTPAEAPAPPPRPVDDHFTAADAARRREAEREAETTPESPGPEIHVDEPWEGYDRMTVTEVRRRLQGVNPTVTAMVRLYEETHKNRKGVLDATGGFH